MFSLEATARNIKNRPDGLRRKGVLPAVFYGGKKEATPVAIDMAAFKKVWKGAGESTLISLSTPSGKIDTLLHDVQLDPVTGEPLHADFYVVDKDVAIEVDVPLEFVGVSPAVKDLGGILVKVLHDIGVKTLPGSIPHGIEVDISKLATLDDVITVADLPFPKGVEPTEKPTEIVAAVSVAKEEEEAPPAPIDLSAIEVEKRGKEEEEGAEAAPEAEK